MDDAHLAALARQLAEALEGQGLEAPHPRRELPPQEPARTRQGLGLGWILLGVLGGAGAGSFGGYQLILSASPIEHPPAIAPRLAVDVAQADAALRDAVIAGEVAERLGAAMARGTVDCSIEWRTQDGELVVRDRVRGTTDTKGRAHRYRVGEGQEH